MQQLLDECKDGLNKFLQASEMKDVNTENIATMAGRLQTKTKALGKQLSKKTDESIDESLSLINDQRAKYVAISKLTKAAEGAEKMLKKAEDKTVEDGYAAMALAGVNNAELPVVLVVFPT